MNGSRVQKHVSCCRCDQLGHMKPRLPLNDHRMCVLGAFGPKCMSALLCSAHSGGMLILGMNSLTVLSCPSLRLCSLNWQKRVLLRPEEKRAFFLSFLRQQTTVSFVACGTERISEHFLSHICSVDVFFSPFLSKLPHLLFWCCRRCQHSTKQAQMGWWRW